MFQVGSPAPVSVHDRHRSLSSSMVGDAKLLQNSCRYSQFQFSRLSILFGGCLLEGRFTVKWYTVEVFEALSENCCRFSVRIHDVIDDAPCAPKSTEEGCTPMGTPM